MTAGASDEVFRQKQSVEIVWTGPASRSTAFRRTDQALLELIESAAESLIIVTFAAYKLSGIADAIVKAGARHVDIALVVETKETSAGHYVHKELATKNSQLLSVAKVYTWPLDNRPTDSFGNRGSLHAKCAIADDKMAFVSSANLTEYALNINMEMGVLVKGGVIPQLMQTHFRGLIREGILAELKSLSRQRAP
jgi:phosphatidylserine/phosphatidylglycerophosphate/cardiolipin synthase-like enzyme